jgi:hypothetical protein
MRKKPIPSPIETARERGIARPLSPARVSSCLPTAAALALMLAGFGCSMPIDDGVRPDPVNPSTIKKQSPAPSASPSAIQPDPHELDGDVAVVKPVPVPTVKPYVPGPKPIHKTAGKPVNVHPLGHGSSI